FKYPFISSLGSSSWLKAGKKDPSKIMSINKNIVTVFDINWRLYFLHILSFHPTYASQPIGRHRLADGEAPKL
ncbi:MAG: hypothetical protein KAQ62_21560, partial [Cyclobacteriaceae bacterium]|nr:hypothetical protein [Cyclobacteriaceae bacterium]